MFLKRAIVLVFAYLVAATSVGPVFSLLSGDFDLLGSLMLTPMTATFALPGFVVLRSLLAWFRQRNVYSFAIAGMINGAGASLGFLREVPPPLVIAGLVAGIVYFTVEHKILGAVMVRPGPKEAPN